MLSEKPMLCKFDWMLQEHELTFTTVIFHRSPAVHNQQTTLVNQAGTVTYSASHLHSSNSLFNSERHNSHKRLNLLSNNSSSSSSSNNNNNSREYHPRRSPNNQQTNKTTNKRSSQRRISQAVAAMSSRHLVYVPTASYSSKQMAMEV